VLYVRGSITQNLRVTNSQHGIVYDLHALFKWYEAFWVKTQEQNHAGLIQSGQYHTTWNGLVPKKKKITIRLVPNLIQSGQYHNTWNRLGYLFGFSKVMLRTVLDTIE
jgi:hypothetical protein